MNQDVANSKRIMSLFSCGVASAVATKMALEQNKSTYHKPLIIVNNYVEQEHPDNARFLQDCEKWFEHDITVTKNEKYDGDIYKVFESEHMIKQKFFAPCTEKLKREVRDKMMEEGDVIVIGFTVEEKKRYARFKEATTNYTVWAPLIENNFNKADCFDLMNRAGIELPAMYKQGYRNNNCIGCVKGGMGYWNKIRKDYPLQFQRMSDLEQRFGEGAFLFRDPKTSKRISLKDLDPNAGNYAQEEDSQCSVMCSITPLFFKDIDGEIETTEMT